MPTETLAANAFGAQRRWWPEVLLAVLAGAVFLGCLGSVDLWGKREQRASAEAIDTVDHNHWLVAQIQGRPRLEKPPLPRWSIAALMILTGRRDEWIVRLPGALVGRGDGGPHLCTGASDGGPRGGTGLGLGPLFAGVLRGRDAPGQQRRSARAVHHPGSLRGLAPAPRPTTKLRLPRISQDRRSPGSGPLGGPGTWCCPLALGLGFLTKGPIILLLVGVTVVPYLAFSRRLTWGLRRLVDGRGLLIFAALALSWPAAVLLRRSRRAAGLVAGDVGEDRSVAHPGASPAFTAGRAVARHGAPLDAHRRWSRCCCRSLGDHEPRGETEPDAVRSLDRADRRRSGSPGGGRWATWWCSAPGRSPSRIITSPACPAWPC